MLLDCGSFPKTDTLIIQRLLQFLLEVYPSKFHWGCESNDWMETNWLNPIIRPGGPATRYFVIWFVWLVRSCAVHTETEAHNTSWLPCLWIWIWRRFYMICCQPRGSRRSGFLEGESRRDKPRSESEKGLTLGSLPSCLLPDRPWASIRVSRLRWEGDMQREKQ